MLTQQQLATRIKNAAKEAGFDVAGVTSLEPEDFPELAAFAEWIHQGHAGEMKYIEKRTAAGELQRASARNAAPWAKSIVVCAINYNSGHPYSIATNDSRNG